MAVHMAAERMAGMSMGKDTVFRAGNQGMEGLCRSHEKGLDNTV
jgi:hypothetical protein